MGSLSPVAGRLGGLPAWRLLDLFVVFVILVVFVVEDVINREATGRQPTIAHLRVSVSPR
jgi:hypothetical protein